MEVQQNEKVIYLMLENNSVKFSDFSFRRCYNYVKENFYETTEDDNTFKVLTFEKALLILAYNDEKAIAFNHKRHNIQYKIVQSTFDDDELSELADFNGVKSNEFQDALCSN